MKNSKVDLYMVQGCMRCKLGATPACKVHRWRSILDFLREIALNSGLVEELKWSMPCYTYNSKNVFMLAAFKEYCCISFFKGELLKDKENVLVKSGENSNVFRQLRFTSIEEAYSQREIIETYIQEALENEKSGLKVQKKEQILDFPEELIAVFEEDQKFENAFKSLTPGRQRSYVLHFNQAKQAQTRISRIEKSREGIFAGKGHNER